MANYLARWMVEGRIAPNNPAEFAEGLVSLVKLYQDALKPAAFLMPLS